MDPPPATSQFTGRLKLAIAVVAYEAALILAYVEWVSPAYGYQSFVNRHPSLALVTIACIFAAIPVIWIQQEIRRPSQMIYWILFLLAYIPSQLMPWFVLTSPSLILRWNLTLLISMWLIHAISRHSPRHNLVAFETRTAFMLLAGAIAAITIVIAAREGVSPSSISLSGVYTRRLQFSTTAASLGGAVGYLVPWTGNVVNPLLIAFGLSKHSRVLVLAGICGQLLLFGLHGEKTILLSPLFIYLIYRVLRSGKLHRVGYRLTVAAGTITALGAILALRFNMTVLMNYVVRRVMLVPGVLSSFYLDFFSAHQHTLFAHTLLKGFLRSPYPLPVPFLIGTTYIHNPTTAANANIFADGYAGYGFIGVIFIAALTGVVLRALDLTACRRDRLTVLCVSGMLGLTMSNGALSTSLITHGIILAMALFALMPPEPEHGGGRGRASLRLSSDSSIGIRSLSLSGR